MSQPGRASRARLRPAWRWTAALATTVALVAVLGACAARPPPSTGDDVVKALAVGRFATAAEDSTQFHGIWKEWPSQRQLNQNQQFLQELSPAVTRVVPEVNTTAAQSWLNYYQGTTDDVVTLIGHNDGIAFRFSDGSRLALRDLEQLDGPPLVFLSCDSYTVAGQVVGVPGELTLAMAAAMEQRIVATVATLDAPPTSEQLRDLIVPIYSNEVLRARARLGVKIGGGVTVVSAAGTVVVRISEQY